MGSLDTLQIQNGISGGFSSQISNTIFVYWIGPQSLFTTSAGMDSSNLNFGHPQTRTTFTGYIPHLPDGDYSIYREGQNDGR